MSSSLKKDEYNAIIIGAGIGGLVCGCYLAKAGMKVLIVEKNDKPGGYCTSFKRNDFVFDACIHSLESLRLGGHLDTLFKDLNIDRKNFLRKDPSNIIITPKHKIIIWNDVNKTISELQERFPYEARNIRKLIQSIHYVSLYRLYSEMQNKTFADILNEYFNNKALKEIFKMFLGCLYEPSFEISAFTAISTIREYIFDSGYYPAGGLQSFSDILLKKFKNFGGDFILKSEVKKIVIKNKSVQGVILNNKEFKSCNIISNCDARHTFFKLIGQEYLENSFKEKLKKLAISSSALIVYLGLKNKRLDINSFSFTNSNDVDKIFFNKNKLTYSKTYVICFSPSNYDSNCTYNKQSIVLLTGVPYLNYNYWKTNKLNYADNLIFGLREAMGKIDKDIIFKEVASPITLERLTYNYNGAFRGWAPVFKQDKIDISLDNQFKGLLFVGHWSTRIGRGGLPMVVSSGKKVAQIILNNKI